MLVDNFVGMMWIVLVVLSAMCAHHSEYERCQGKSSLVGELIYFLISMAAAMFALMFAIDIAFSFMGSMDIIKIMPLFLLSGTTILLGLFSGLIRARLQRRQL